MIVRVKPPALVPFRTAGGELVHPRAHPLSPGVILIHRASSGQRHVLLPWRRGLGQTSGADFWSGLASAIQQVEGFYPPGTPGYPQGSLAWRNNNPGNLRPGSLAVGSTGTNGGYAVFPAYPVGLSALIGLEQSPGYAGLTLTQFFAKYAPSADNNNPAAYAATVAASLGVDPNTPISALAAGDSGASGGASDSADTSGDGSISDALGGISPVALGVLAGVVGLALVL